MYLTSVMKRFANGHFLNVCLLVGSMGLPSTASTLTVNTGGAAAIQAADLAQFSGLQILQEAAGDNSDGRQQTLSVNLTVPTGLTVPLGLVPTAQTGNQIFSFHHPITH